MKGQRNSDEDNQTPSKLNRQSDSMLQEECKSEGFGIKEDLGWSN
jgi:hypothetical protein